MILLIGASGSGKSTFARKHFRRSEILSSDFYREAVADDPSDLTATTEAFEIVHLIAARRLARGRLTVIDATNVRPDAREPLIRLAREYRLPVTAIVFDLPEHICQRRNRRRRGRTIPGRAVHLHVQQLRESLPGLDREGLDQIVRFSSPAQIDAVRIQRRSSGRAASQTASGRRPVGEG